MDFHLLHWDCKLYRRGSDPSNSRKKEESFYNLYACAYPSLWPKLGKENRYFYSRHSNNNDRWSNYKKCVFVLMHIYNRHGRYWQIAKPRFIVAWSGIKMRFGNTGFISRTAQILDTFYVKYCSVQKIYLNFATVFLIIQKKCITTYHFYAYDLRPKLTTLQFFNICLPNSGILLS